MIHKFTQGNINIVMDVNSGAIHVVDSLVYDLLDYYLLCNIEEIKNIFKDKYSPESIEEAAKEIETLIRSNMLYSTERYFESESFKNKQPVVKALCLHIAHDCNIQCRYCFASQGNFKGDRILMSLQAGKKAVDFLLENSGSRKNVEIDFFGGEPLMNFETVKEIVKYGREKEKEYDKKIRFTLTTNGILLNKENMDYINENMDNVVLSIDGRKEINDCMRTLNTGEGTYSIVLPRFLEMARIRKDKNCYVRGTFTRLNLDFAEDVLHLASLGFKNISVEPVVASEGQDYAISEENLPEIFRQYEYLAEEYIKRKNTDKSFQFFHFMIDLKQGPCAIKRVSGCGAGTEYMAVTPEGDLYPCHQFVGNKDFLLGSVFSDKVNRDTHTAFSDAHIYNKEACKTCWAKFYCSGGCHANAYAFNQDIHKPYDFGCHMEKKRIECAIMIQARLTEEE